MSSIEKLATGRAKYTLDYPELGTGPVSYEDSISEEFYQAEHEAIFRRTWLKVGRVEQLPRNGTFFTREFKGLGSIVISRHTDGEIYALHNVCAHRGNKVVWQEHPGEESKGSARQFQCKYHGWRYGLDGKCSYVTKRDQFFDSLPEDGLGMPQLRCEVLAGFIFVNFSQDAPTLRDFLGEKLVTELEAWPFEKFTNHWGFKTLIKGNWKIGIDALLEWYHPAYVHGRFLNADMSKAEKLVPPMDSYHYDLFAPHMLTSVPGPPPLKKRTRSVGPAQRDQDWVYRLFRGGIFGPDDLPEDIDYLTPERNPGNVQYWSNDQYWLFPNLSIQLWHRGYYITYQYIPESVGTHSYEVDIYFPEPKNVTERLGQELVVDSTIEFAMQDTNTVEATWSALNNRALGTFHLSDMELMIRQFHHVVREAVAAYQAGKEK
ncbi:aromatic ring-hydroxylating oxygenase subunit alpha [Pseudofrankia saprophytica]|uniref:aromatic ring-hydroxylating oxygenase subunit alpha n=1 Tax=Pseudofrankia saprophytica TaxID=298655 RepID=UPI000234CD4C|nr:aromatic ring-hydroxylating dioxygenase subunit alpha [Pseudofrankia saprophytica]